MTKPPAPNAPSMPTTRPRMSGVLPMKAQPSTIVRQNETSLLDGSAEGAAAARRGMSSRQITSAATR